MKKTNILGVIAGIFIIIIAVKIMYTSTSISYYPRPQYVANEYYGGDAYTGIQQAGAQTANNVSAVYELIGECTEKTNDLIRSGFSALLFAIGLITLAKSIVINKKSPATAPEVCEAPAAETFAESCTEPASESTEPASESKVCINCGAKLPDNQSFCTACGVKVE